MKIRKLKVYEIYFKMRVRPFRPSIQAILTLNPRLDGLPSPIQEIPGIKTIFGISLKSAMITLHKMYSANHKDKVIRLLRYKQLNKKAF